jgi:H+/Cl- antiporter ClcA
MMHPPQPSTNVPGYALVGAVAFASGVTHTISAAVIAVEMTGNLPMLLPCLVVAVIAAGITKVPTPSVYHLSYSPYLAPV